MFDSVESFYGSMTTWRGEKEVTVILEQVKWLSGERKPSCIGLKSEGIEK